MKGKKGIGPAEDEEEKAPKQERLPTMEDPAIEEIEEAALDYAKIRDKRMVLTDHEVGAKDRLLTFMQKHEKMSYHRSTKKGVIDVKRVPEGEKLKVRIEDEE